MQTDRRHWIYLLLGILPMLGYWQTGLFDLDEGFYGAIAVEMNRRGEWLTPYYAGKPWFEKPILIYWLAKPLISVFGLDFGPRLVGVLSSLGTLALISDFARKQLSPVVGRLAPLMLGGSLLFAVAGQMLLTDGPLVFALTGAWCAFWNSLQRPENRWQFGAWLGLSVLAKGPVGIILSVPLVLWSYWRFTDRRAGFRGGWLGFAAALGLVVSSWYLPAYLINRETFVQKFLIEQNLNRFTGGDVAHTWQSPFAYFFFVPILLLGSAPWWWFAVRRARTNSVTEFLTAWWVIVFVFFTLSGAKLVHYVLPCLPAIAMLAADAFGDRERNGEILAGVMLAACSLVAWVGLPIYYAQSGQQVAHRLIRGLPRDGRTVALYQIGKRDRNLGTGSTQLRETSLPSLWMYAHHPLVNVEDHIELRSLPLPAYIFTRANRTFGDENWIRGANLNPVLISEPDLPFRVYRLEEGLRLRSER